MSILDWRFIFCYHKRLKGTQMPKLVFKKRLLPLICSAILSPYTIAEASTDELQVKGQEAKDTKTEVIEIWSTQIKTSSLYLQGQDIASKQADHISDLLRTVPGVDVGGAHSLNQRITIRSMDDKDLKISIDGASQNTYMYHHMGNLQIHADILKSVDIEIGTNSVINGGLGGAVRFETKEAKDLLSNDQDFGARLQVGAGNNSGSSVSMTGYGQLTESVDFLAYINRVGRDNFEVGGGEIKDENGQVIAGTDGTVRGIEGDLTDVLFKVGYDIGQSHRVAFSVESYKDEGDYSYRPDMGLATDLAIKNAMFDLWGLDTPLVWPTEFSRDTATLSYIGNLGDTTELRISLFTNESELWRDERAWGESDPYSGYVTGTATNDGLNVIAESSLELGGVEHELTYGLDYLTYTTEYKHDAIYIENGITTSGEELTSTSVFVQDKVQLTDALFVTPGVRFDHADLDSVMVDNTFSEVSFALAGEYYLNEDLVVKLSTTQLFKAPEIAEVFIGAGLNSTENQDIDAETGVNTEFAIAYQTELQSDVALNTGVTFFNTTIDDYIYDYATEDWTPDNIGDMEITGAEFYLGVDSGALSANLTYSVAESELDAAAGYEKFEGARLDRQQGDTISGNVSYVLSNAGVKLNWEVLNVADVDNALDIDGASLDKTKEGFTIHNVSAMWQPKFNNALSVVVGVDNVFDEYYASQSSRTGVSFHPRFGNLSLTDYEPGRNVKATVSYTF